MRQPRARARHVQLRAYGVSAVRCSCFSDTVAVKCVAVTGRMDTQRVVVRETELESMNAHKDDAGCTTDVITVTSVHEQTGRDSDKAPKE